MPIAIALPSPQAADGAPSRGFPCLVLRAVDGVTDLVESDRRACPRLRGDHSTTSLMRHLRPFASVSIRKSAEQIGSPLQSRSLRGATVDGDSLQLRHRVAPGQGRGLRRGGGKRRSSACSAPSPPPCASQSLSRDRTTVMATSGPFGAAPLSKASSPRSSPSTRSLT
jgi:hypothetical protein